MSQQITQLSPTEKAKGVTEGFAAPERPRTAWGGFTQAFSSSSVTVLVVVIAVMWSIPTFGLFVASFRPPQLIASTGWWSGLVPPWHFTIENYQAVILQQGFGQAFLNSLIIAIPGTLLPIAVGSFAAYAFAWMKFPIRDFLFFLVVAMLVIPNQIALVPILPIFTSIGFTGQYWSVWIVHTAFGLPFAIFLLRNFFSALPKDLIESAHIDGASSCLFYWTLLLPLSVPPLPSLTIFQFIPLFTHFLFALIFIDSAIENTPLTLAVANLLSSY